MECNFSIVTRSLFTVAYPKVEVNNAFDRWLQSDGGTKGPVAPVHAQRTAGQCEGEVGAE
jgi:hypothetical protein